MTAMRLMVAGATLGAGTALAVLLGIGDGEPDRVSDLVRPIPSDIRTAVAMMPAEPAPGEGETDAAALSMAVLAALERAEAAPEAAAPDLVVVQAAGSEEAPVFRLEAAADWIAASGVATPEIDLRPMPRRN